MSDRRITADTVTSEVMCVRALMTLMQAVHGDAEGALADAATRAHAVHGPVSFTDLHDGLAKLLEAVEEARSHAAQLPEHEALPLLEAIGDLSDELEVMTQRLFERKGMK